MTTTEKLNVCRKQDTGKACKLVLNADTEALRQLANEYKQYA